MKKKSSLEKGFGIVVKVAGGKLRLLINDLNIEYFWNFGKRLFDEIGFSRTHQADYMDDLYQNFITPKFLM